MRTLLTLGAIVAAMLVPWSSLAPTWLPDASGSSISAAAAPTAGKSSGPAARLNPALGILPIASESDEAAKATASNASSSSAFEAIEKLIGKKAGAGSDSAGTDGKPPGVICENGVCRLVDQSEAGSSQRSDATKADGESGRERLRQLGATQFLLDQDASGDESRCSCLIPVGAGSRVVRRFEAAGASDAEAISRLLQQIESWLQERE